jgi:prolyl-tRNA synthetase
MGNTMLWTKTFIPTLREIPQEAESLAHQLMLRAGLVRRLMAGVYSFLPLGLRCLNNLCGVIRQEMDNAGATELLLPALQPRELWLKSGRDKEMGEVMIRFTDRRGRQICLGPTHEEVITDLLSSHISSYKQLPLILYQIQAKFRDEIRPRFGLVRACEFIMKDAYSFDRDEEGLKKNYRLIFEVYNRIFTRCGLDFFSVEADPGVMGGSTSHEFMVVSQDAEDAILACPACRLARPFKEGASEHCPQCKRELEKVNTLELGHTFKLGTKYSLSLGANFLDEKGSARPLIMGCYGIGVSRVIPAIIECNNDKNGIVWPPEIAPYQVILLALDTTEEKIMQAACALYAKLKSAKVEVLFDDRDERAGVKFNDADLLGIPFQIIVGRDTLKDGKVELKVRKSNERIKDKAPEVIKRLSLLAGKG